MAAVPITIHGVIYPSAKGGRGASDQPFKATIVGLAWNSHRELVPKQKWKYL